MIEILRELWSMSPRIYENEMKTAFFITSFLRRKKLESYIQEYKVLYPVYRRYYLFVDGEKISCLPSCFSSGRIKEKVLIDSFEAIFKEIEPEKPTINYNPFCNEISTPVFFQKPSLTIKRSDVQKIINANEVDGKVLVSWKKYKSYNIMVGNIKNPRKILFVHYDSLWGGVIDNGVAVSMILEMIDRVDLNRNLMVFSGSEEISHEYPIYWGYGFRVFEEEFYDLLEISEKIIVLDSVGYKRAKIIKGKELLSLFPIKSKEFLEKTIGIACDLKDLFSIYHSWEDNVSKIDKFIVDKVRLLIWKFLNN